MSSDARENEPIRSLAYAAPCRYCRHPIYVAICRDGKWRSFEQTVHPADTTTWAWRRTCGMEETDRVPGHHLHYCAEYSKADLTGIAS